MKQVIKWLHSLSWLPECYQEKTWECPFKRLTVKENIPPMAKILSCFMNMKQENEQQIQWQQSKSYIAYSEEMGQQLSC